ncbi:MAG: hypothetical protein JXA06_04720 [Bacteroidetes bacterium]|nr:hypothetical protein [Bacteroidota bacterium]
MPQLPSICTNPKCGMIFASPINLLATDNTFINLLYGICPKCGTVGRIPNGKYSSIGDQLFATLFDIPDIAILNNYVSFVSEKVHSGLSPEIIKESVNNEFPQLKPLSDLIPQTRSDAYAFIGILLTLIGLTIECCNKYQTKDPPIEVKQEIINQSFQNFYISGDSVNVYVKSNNCTKLNTK